MASKVIGIDLGTTNSCVAVMERSASRPPEGAMPMKITDLIPWRGPGREVATRTADMDPIRALQVDVDRAFDHFWRMVP